MRDLVDVLIIGAGQQGLALGARLKERGQSVLILEAREAIGSRWREHYDSLTLFTPRYFSGLLGLPMEGEPKGYAGKDEFASYLERYARHFDLPVVLGAEVHRLTKEGGLFHAETSQGTFGGRAVVVATGYTKPALPTFAKENLLGAFSTHSSAYKNPRQIPGKRVLVVGTGNSAAQIAVELAPSHDVEIAMRRMPAFIPRRILGKSYYWWGETLGLHRVASDSWIRKVFPRGPDPIVGRELITMLREGRVTRRPQVVGTEGDTVVFEDGTKDRYGSVIWATGFKSDLSWIGIPGTLSPEGKPLHRRGVSPVDGLFYAGLENQLTSISSNIYGVRHVSEHLVRHLGM